MVCAWGARRSENKKTTKEEQQKPQTKHSDHYVWSTMPGKEKKQSKKITQRKARDECLDAKMERSDIYINFSAFSRRNHKYIQEIEWFSCAKYAHQLPSMFSFLWGILFYVLGFLYSGTPLLLFSLSVLPLVNVFFIIIIIRLLRFVSVLGNFFISIFYFLFFFKFRSEVTLAGRHTTSRNLGHISYILFSFASTALKHRV